MTTATLEDYAQVVGLAPSVSIQGSGSKAEWRLPGTVQNTPVDILNHSGIIDYSPNDQVVNVRAGTRLRDLQAELASHGQCLPMVQWNDGWSHLDLSGTVGGSLSMNLPHELEAECGSWRDWVLGMRLVLADGTVAKTGSHAVKNVAGYDIHKLMIGARGTLALITEVILRTYPIKSLPEPRVTRREGEKGPCGWIQRVKRSDFEWAVTAAYTGIDIAGTSTIVRYLPEGVALPRYEGDWVLRSNSREQNLQIDLPALSHYMRRAKAILDPAGKFNAGEMGLF
jgi:FAD/FMN-containing dehydrogenase